MKNLFAIADAYVDQSDWTDYALVKLCLAAIGVAVGVSLPEKHKKTAMTLSAALFFITYVPLMNRFARVIGNYEKSSAKE